MDLRELYQDVILDHAPTAAQFPRLRIRAISRTDTTHYAAIMSPSS